MYRIIKALNKWGCSTESALERFLNDENFYFEMLMEFTKEPGFDMLSDALNEGRMEDAFEYSHMLKGVAANLGLSPLHVELVRLTDALRGEADMKAAAESHERAAALFEKFRSIMACDTSFL